MSQLTSLLEAVREPNLSKDKLEGYRDELSNLFALMHLELAEVRKAKALYFDQHPEKTDKATERKWQVTPEGLREIELSHFSKGVEKVLSSLKSRLYNVY